MYTHQISIQVADETNLPDAVSEFEFLLAAYRSSGQILGKYDRIFVKDNRITVVVNTQEEDSLAIGYNNYYVNLRIERLDELCGNAIEIVPLGLSHDHEEACQCVKSDFYLLITDLVSIDSPVKCGTCFDVVPMYKLPAYYEHGYAPVLDWENNYQACDRLQIQCEVGEEWALEQMGNPNSELSVQGREICSVIEEKTSTPTYYYLHNVKETTVEEELDSVCPACKTPWLLTQPLAGGIFPFKCDNCRLVSTFSTNLQG
jgi:predicted  nucleic acid-binding Zn ribbon protein